MTMGIFWNLIILDLPNIRNPLSSLDPLGIVPAAVSLYIRLTPNTMMKTSNDLRFAMVYVTISQVTTDSRLQMRPHRNYPRHYIPPLCLASMATWPIDASSRRTYSLSHRVEAYPTTGDGTTCPDNTFCISDLLLRTFYSKSQEFFFKTYPNSFALLDPHFPCMHGYWLHDPIRPASPRSRPSPVFLFAPLRGSGARIRYSSYAMVLEKNSIRAQWLKENTLGHPNKKICVLASFLNPFYSPSVNLISTFLTTIRALALDSKQVEG